MENVVKRTDNTISIHFHSIMDFMEFKPTGEAEANNGRAFKNFLRGSGDRKWFGPTNKNASQVITHALVGDISLGKRVTKMWAELDAATNKNTQDYTQRIQVARRKRVRKSFGDELDIHKVYQGQLDTAWSATERVVTDVQHSLITLFVDIGGNANDDAVKSLWRATVITRLVDELVAAGKSVRVLAGGASQDTYYAEKRKSTVSCVVKEYNEHLSVDRLAAMTHTGFYRVFGFAAKMAYHHKAVSSLGYSVNIHSAIPVQIQEEIDEGHTRIIHVDKCMDVTQAIRALERCYEQMKQYGEEE